MKRLLLAVSTAAALAGCAEGRYLTKAQDDEFRENCGSQGCTCMPRKEWEGVEQLLRRLGVWSDA